MLIGTPAAYLIGTRRFRGRSAVITAVELPLVLPPAVAGIGLLAAFAGRIGLLSDILQLQNIDSNVQLLMKGLIIVGTVLVQEQNLGQLLRRWRGQAPPPPSTRTGSVEVHRPPQTIRTSNVREDIHEAS